MVIYTDYEIHIKEYLKEFGKKVYLLNAKRQEYINFVPMGFDIETYTQYKKDSAGHVIEHYTNMYIWQFQFADITFIGRTWEEFNNLITAIEKHLCTANHKTICFICNQSFEFSFIGKELLARKHNVEVFARKPRHPMKIVVDEKIIFLDTYLITGYSLAVMAKNYCHTQKLVGDLDYKIPRNSMTELSDQELQYCINDVVILAEYAIFYAENYLKNKFMPMTATMIANRVIKHKTKELKATPFYIMQDCYPKSLHQYLYIMKFYSGAYTHGMLINLFQQKENGCHFDVNSEYPWAFFQYYPMGKFRYLKDKSKLSLYLKNCCCLCEVVFHNIKSKTGVTILSEHKCEDENNCVWDNGRLWKGESIKAYITEVDLQTLSMHYSWESIDFVNVLYAKRGYLPDYFLLAVAELYSKKCLLKGVEGKEIEYMQSKKNLNGLYGSLCTKLQLEEIIFTEEGWSSREKEIDFNTIWKSKDKSPTWAIYVTSHSRHLILSQIKRVIDTGGKESYWYSDTDSIFAANTDKIINCFLQRNKEIATANESWINRLNLKELYPEVDFTQLGQFAQEHENGISKFKTLGSKRYLLEYEGKLECTVAGLPKGVYQQYCTDNNLDPFKTFTNMLSFDDMESNKLTAYYEDNPKTWIVEDKQGNTEYYHAESYVSLIETSFTLSIADKLSSLFNIVTYNINGTV